MGFGRQILDGRDNSHILVVSVGDISVFVLSVSSVFHLIFGCAFHLGDGYLHLSLCSRNCFHCRCNRAHIDGDSLGGRFITDSACCGYGNHSSSRSFYGDSSGCGNFCHRGVAAAVNKVAVSVVACVQVKGIAFRCSVVLAVAAGDFLLFSDDTEGQCLCTAVVAFSGYNDFTCSCIAVVSVRNRVIDTCRQLLRAVIQRNCRLLFQTIIFVAALRKSSAYRRNIFSDDAEGFRQGACIVAFAVDNDRSGTDMVVIQISYGIIYIFCQRSAIASDCWSRRYFFTRINKGFA